MFTPTRVLGLITFGLGVGLVAHAQPGTPERKINPTVAEVLKLADCLERPDVSVRAKKIVDDPDNACDISLVFRRTRPRGGGVGIGSAVKAGHQNSIDDLIRDWSGRRPPTKDELHTHQKDLLQVARVLQAMAELAPFRVHIYVPRNDQQKAAEWQKVSADFKAITRALREAIDQRDPAETRNVAIRLQRTCDACHQLAGR
jgi:hypothetical protein